MYIQVRRRALAQPQATTGTPAQLADVAAAERRAAAELGLDVEEYRWVGARIAEASPPAPDALGGLAGPIEAAAAASRDRILEKPGGQPAPARPGATGKDEAARADNRKLLERYRADLDALGSRPDLPASVPERPRR